MVLLLLLALFFIFHKLRRDIITRFRTELDQIEEKNNLLNDSSNSKNKILKTLPERCQKVSSLFNISQQLVELDEPEEIVDFLINYSKELFPQVERVLLFLIQKDNDSLTLIRSFKKNGYVIKDKNGDILEKWVLKNNQSLLVEDLTKDFRFDYNKVIAFQERQSRSFMVSPLSIKDKIVGILRLESKVPLDFSLEDTRILRSICDFGVVVLERANLFKKTEELAIKDSLTSLFLKDYFFSRFKEEIKRAHIKKTTVGLCMLDIDDFKKINDTYGHVVGDFVLKRLSKILLQEIGNGGNIICRFGGEEFIFFVVESTRDQIVNLAESIRKKVEKITVTFRKRTISFTISLGVAVYPSDGIDALELVDKVDQYLYQAKREGKNKVCASS